MENNDKSSGLLESSRSGARIGGSSQSLGPSTGLGGLFEAVSVFWLSDGSSGLREASPVCRDKEVSFKTGSCT